MRAERGQGTVEYLAVVLLVALVMGAAAALLVATGLGPRIVREIRHALCVVTGGGCGREVREAQRPCVVASDRRDSGGQLTLTVVRIGEHEVVLRERLADGRVALTFVDEHEAGIDAGVGVGGHVRWGSFERSVGTELRMAVLAERGAGRTWMAADDGEASRILERARLEALSSQAEGTIPYSDDYGPIGPTHVKVHAPEPDVTFSERGSDLELDFGLRNRARVQVSYHDAYGERLDHRTGERTVYVRGSVEGEGRVSFAGVSLKGGGAGEERYAITLDREGHPVDLMVLSTLDVDGAVGLPARLSRIAGWLKIPASGAKHVETEQHLDLTTGGNGELAAAFLDGLGEGRLGVRVAARALRERLEHDGTLSVRTYSSDQDVHEIGGHARLGVGVGGESGSSDATAKLVAAVARRPDGTWGIDESCFPGSSA